ncbi:MarR family winged helix-turn-helix transcriptional regulator [Hyphomonas sp.]|uniref:MarR family winged helix-turn-helix transcriptional regulator n=1 Tax=Hyphomonas sp. TaxID=87 RepID=UPI003D2DA61A
MASTTNFNLNKSPSHLLHRAQQIAANHSAAALKAAGVTLRQFSVLAALSGNEGVSQSDLVNATGIDRSTLADMVARMEKAGLIKRAASKADARAKSVSLMAKGRKALEKAQPAVDAADAALFDAMPKTKQDALLSGLAKLVEDTEAADAKPTKPKTAPASAPTPAPTVVTKAKPKAKAKPKTKPKAKAAPKAAAAPKPAAKAKAKPVRRKKK